MLLLKGMETKSVKEVWSLLSNDEKMLMYLGGLWYRQLKFDLDLRLLSVVSNNVRPGFLKGDKK